MHDDLNCDPGVRQVIQSPANISAERYDCQSMQHGSVGERRMQLPAEYRQSERTRVEMPVTRVKIRVSRLLRGRR